MWLAMGGAQATYDGRELIVVPDQDELVRATQGPDNGRQRDLTGLIDDAIVEAAAVEQRTSSQFEFGFKRAGSTH